MTSKRKPESLFITALFTLLPLGALAWDDPYPELQIAAGRGGRQLLQYQSPIGRIYSVKADPIDGSIEGANLSLPTWEMTYKTSRPDQSVTVPAAFPQAHIFLDHWIEKHIYNTQSPIVFVEQTEFKWQIREIEPNEERVQGVPYTLFTRKNFTQKKNGDIAVNTTVRLVLMSDVHTLQWQSQGHEKVPVSGVIWNLEFTMMGPPTFKLQRQRGAVTLVCTYEDEEKRIPLTPLSIHQIEFTNSPSSLVRVTRESWNISGDLNPENRGHVQSWKYPVHVKWTHSKLRHRLKQLFSKFL